MGKRGPRKTPTKILQARGSRKTSSRSGEPQPAQGETPCPAWVLGDARQHWSSIVPMLEGMGLMSPAYSPGLGLLVNSLGRYIEYENRVTESGPVSVTDNGNEIVNPWWAARNKAWDQVLKALREFGLTPSAMTSVRATDQAKPKEGDGLASIINPNLKLA